MSMICIIRVRRVRTGYATHAVSESEGRAYANAYFE